MYLFLMTHLGSDSPSLCSSLSKQPYIYKGTKEKYDHITDLLDMKEQDYRARIYFDEINFNHSFIFPVLYKFCKFIYILKEPRIAISRIVKSKYDLEGACLYYTFRLRRLYEMANRTKGALLQDKLDAKMISDYLGIRDFSLVESEEESVRIPSWVDRRYDYYLSKMRKLLVQPSHSS